MAKKTAKKKAAPQQEQQPPAQAEEQKQPEQVQEEKPHREAAITNHDLLHAMNDMQKAFTTEIKSLKMMIQQYAARR